MCVCMCVHQVTSVVSDSLWPHELEPIKLLCPWDSPGKNVRVGFHVLLHGIFPAQVSNPHLLHPLHWQTGFLPWVPPGNPCMSIYLIFFICSSVDGHLGCFYILATGNCMSFHSSVLAWRTPGTAEPGGRPSVGSHSIGHGWSDLAAAAAADIRNGISDSRDVGVNELMLTGLQSYRQCVAVSSISPSC